MTKKKEVNFLLIRELTNSFCNYSASYGAAGKMAKRKSDQYATERSNPRPVQTAGPRVEPDCRDIRVAPTTTTAR